MDNNLNILLVEDDEIEMMKFSRAMGNLNQSHRSIIAENGERALEALERVLPNIIFLDLNMPKMTGLEFLREIKSVERLKFIPVIILTTSNNHKDTLAAYELGVAGYFVKPLRFEKYTFLLEKIIGYWSHNEFVK